jgi:Ca2+-transporting ATPase
VRDAAGATLLPLTALQLLWINFLGDGPPALALALDRTPDVMRRSPRVTDGSLLDPGSSWFILSTGLMKGLVGEESARLTVAVETPASAATSSIVIEPE